eukprot:6281065-Prymnesium_polylepis.1
MTAAPSRGATLAVAAACRRLPGARARRAAIGAAPPRVAVARSHVVASAVARAFVWAVDVLAAVGAQPARLAGALAERARAVTRAV